MFCVDAPGKIRGREHRARRIEVRVGAEGDLRRCAPHRPRVVDLHERAAEAEAVRAAQPAQGVVDVPVRGVADPRVRSDCQAGSGRTSARCCCRSSTRSRPAAANMSLVTLVENSSGDHCHPPLNSFTRVGDSVERRLVEPTVRYDGEMPKLGKPGNGASLLLRMSGRGHEAAPGIRAAQPVVRRQVDVDASGRRVLLVRAGALVEVLLRVGVRQVGDRAGRSGGGPNAGEEAARDRVERRELVVLLRERRGG